MISFNDYNENNYKPVDYKTHVLRYGCLFVLSVLGVIMWFILR